MKKCIILFIFIFTLVLCFCKEHNNKISEIDIIPNSESNNSNSESSNNVFNDIELKKFSIPIIIRKNDVRIRTHPSFSADIIAIAKLGASITLTKRTAISYNDMNGNDDYWFFIDRNLSDVIESTQSGWAYGGELFDSEYDYPYKNNLQLVNSNEQLENSLLKNIISKEFILNSSEVKLMYQPTNYSNSMYILKKGSKFNILEKTAFKQDLNGFKNGRWFYIQHRNSENKIINGWIHQSYLPKDVIDSFIEKLPYNHTYKIIEDKPFYLGEVHITNESEVILDLICQITQTGIITEIPLIKSNFNDDINIKNGYIEWSENSLDKVIFHLYFNGEEIGTLTPIANTIKKDENIYVTSKIYLNEKYKSFIGKAIAVSFDLNEDYIPISLNSSTNKDIDSYKAIIDNIVINNFEKESKVKFDDKNYKISKNIDVIPIIHNLEQKYFYIADIRLISKDEKDNFVFKQIGTLMKDNEHNIFENMFRRINSNEALDFIEKYENIIGIIDFDKDKDDEIIVKVSSSIGQRYKLIILTSKSCIIQDL